MKVGIAIEYFDPHRGGAEQWTYQFAERLLSRGHQVHVAAQEFSSAGLELPIVAHRLGRIRSRLGRAEAAEATMRGLRLDLVHDMGMGWYCDVFHSHDGSRFAQWEAKLRALPGWLRPAKRGMLCALPRYREFARLVARQFEDRGQLVVALSQMVARDYQHHHNVPAEQIRLVYNGVDTARFSPDRRAEYREAVRARLGVSAEEMLVLFVGHDFKRKGLETAVRAIGRLTGARHPVRMAVVGGKRLGSARRDVARRGLQEAVIFVGSVADSVPYYAAADVYVLPTFYDPCSLGVLEAAASGLPCLTTRPNGAGELLTDGVEGYVLPDPADDRQLAARLGVLLDDTRRRPMGEAARRLALRHTIERNCDQMVDLYHEALGRRSRCPWQPPATLPSVVQAPGAVLLPVSGRAEVAVGTGISGRKSA